MRIHPSDNLPRLNVSTDWQRIGDRLETRPIPVRMLNDYYLSIETVPRKLWFQAPERVLGPVLLPQDRLRDALPTTADWA